MELWEVLIFLMISVVQSSTDKLGSHTSTLTYEGLPVLDALAVITRSMHNCRVFGFYNGVQNLTALMKGTYNNFYDFSYHFMAAGCLFYLVPVSGVMKNFFFLPSGNRILCAIDCLFPFSLFVSPFVLVGKFRACT